MAAEAARRGATQSDVAGRRTVCVTVDVEGDGEGSRQQPTAVAGTSDAKTARRVQNEPELRT